MIELKKPLKLVNTIWAATTCLADDESLFKIILAPAVFRNLISVVVTFVIWIKRKKNNVIKKAINFIIFRMTANASTFVVGSQSECSLYMQWPVCTWQVFRLCSDWSLYDVNNLPFINKWWNYLNTTSGWTLRVYRYILGIEQWALLSRKQCWANTWFARNNHELRVFSFDIRFLLQQDFIGMTENKVFYILLHALAM